MDQYITTETMEMDIEGETTGMDGATTRQNPIPDAPLYGLRHPRRHGEAPPALSPNE